jgi:hypothetical protein
MNERDGWQALAWGMWDQMEYSRTADSGV